MSLVGPESADGLWTFVAPHNDRLRVAPSRGGLVTGWTCQGPWGEREMLYFDADRFADPAKSVRGGVPVLFPICGALAGGSLPQHGFARDLPWQIAELGDHSGVRLSLRDTPQTRAVFPHPFSLELELRLEPRALAVTARVGNPGGAVLPFCFGLHPYFAVADVGAARISGLPPEAVDQVAGAAARTADLLARLPDGVDMLAGPTPAVRLETADVAVTLETRPPLDLAVVWTDPPRPMVCVEPWTAPRGALASGDRLLRVPPGEGVELGCRFRVGAIGLRGATPCLLP